MLLVTIWGIGGVRHSMQRQVQAESTIGGPAP